MTTTREKLERRNHVRQLMAELHSDAEIREIVMSQYGVSERSAYNDIKKAREISFHTEGRKRMHLGVVEGIITRYRTAMARTQPVACPECKFDGAVARSPNLREAGKIIETLIRTFKLELSAEELLQDEDLAEQVAKATMGYLHLWRPEDLVEMIERAQHLLDQATTAGHVVGTPSDTGHPDTAPQLSGQQITETDDE
jgi:hypothetical protein